MCGIAGMYSTTQDKSDIKLSVSRMLSFLAHRGPDSEGIFVSESICIGARRLAIVDINVSSQPIYNETKSIVLVFNGEIYNFCEIKQILQKKGHVFSTNGDGEVIVHAYEEWGESFLSSLNGMFAFALWDSDNKLLLLARDRFGEKPLFYAESNQGLIFASEINALLKSQQITVEINYASLIKYLVLSYIPAPQTPYLSISKLLPGHYAIWKDGSIKITRYWMPQLFPKQQIPLMDAVDKIEHHLRKSIISQLNCNVPLGVFLSGGLDSSLITSMARQEYSGTLHTFSIAITDNPAIDEQQYAKEVSDYLGTIHHVLPLGLPSWQDVEHVSLLLGEPFADTAMLPTFFLSRLAKDYVKVVLTGDGGDELFGGYSRYRQLISIAEPMKANSEIKTIFDYPSRKNLLKNSKFSGHVVSYDVVDEMEDFGILDSALDQAVALDIRTYLPDDILFKVDIATMSNSIEARCPYLDINVASCALQMPDSYKIYNGQTKSLLRFLGHGYLPDNIINREKQGFTVPLDLWLGKSLKTAVQELLTDRSIKERGLLNKKYIEAILWAHYSGKANHSKQIWVLLMLELWLQNNHL